MLITIQENSEGSLLKLLDTTETFFALKTLWLEKDSLS